MNILSKENWDKKKTQIGITGYSELVRWLPSNLHEMVCVYDGYNGVYTTTASGERALNIWLKSSAYEFRNISDFKRCYDINEGHWLHLRFEV